uniref:Uncharacterized protein n=1 Tax=Myotis myotis TaxID=51298 RepID=A0A7J7Z5W9_MYOMY|nr:hypothetical protein mMyoMyo1_010808 [Myotis myotis]
MNVVGIRVPVRHCVRVRVRVWGLSPSPRLCPGWSLGRSRCPSPYPSPRLQRRRARALRLPAGRVLSPCLWACPWACPWLGSTSKAGFGVCIRVHIRVRGRASVGAAVRIRARDRVCRGGGARACAPQPQSELGSVSVVRSVSDPGSASESRSGFCV